MTGDWTDGLIDSSGWQTNGHVSDLAISLLADGEDELLSPEVREHVDDCVECLDRLTDATLMAVRLQEGLERMSAHAAAREMVPFRFPWLAVACGVALAALGAWPGILRVRTLLDGLMSLENGLALIRSVRMGLPIALEEATELMLVVSVASAILLLLAGALIARAAPFHSFEESSS